MLPASLRTRFSLLREVRPADASGSQLWWVSEHATRQRKLLKCAPNRALVGTAVLAYLRDVAAPNGALLIPSEVGDLGDGTGWELTEVAGEHSTDLRSLLQTMPWPVVGQRVVERLNSALTSIHEQRGGKWVLHGDVKPSNVIASGRTGEDWDFQLADFDAALLMDRYAQRQPVRSRLTVHYAAPESLAHGHLTSAADYWSLGILVLEALRGRHPFEGWSDGEVRQTVSGAWQPDAALIEANDWRALVRGLLRRDTDDRWGAREVEAWLVRNPSTIVDGLRSPEESATTIPFVVAGVSVHSAESLARIALRQWQVVRRDQR